MDASLRREVVVQCFIVYIGDARQNGGVSEIVGAFTTHEAALDAAALVNDRRGYDESLPFGAMIEETVLNPGPNDYLLAHDLNYKEDE